MEINKNHCTINDLAARWGVSTRTIRRMINRGELVWLDLAGKNSKKPIIRFRYVDISMFEEAQLMDITEE